MAPPDSPGTNDANLEALVGDLAGGARGWTCAGVTWARFAEIRYRRGDRTFDAFLAPSDADTGAYRTTARYKVGYRGDAPDADALRLLDDLAARLAVLEAGLAPGDATPWPARDGAADRLSVQDGVLELRVTCRCNEQCPFCNSVDWVENRVDAPGAVDRALRAAPALGVHTVHFTGGEPTLVRGLPDWVVAAKAAGMQAVIQTNALGLEDARFWEAFRDRSGRPMLPDLLFVSFHTRHPARVKALTGVGGTFSRKVAGIRAARARGIPVTLNVVIQRGNLDEVGELPRFVAETFDTGVAIVLSVIAPTGRSSARDAEWPSMVDLAPRLQEALDAAEDLGIEASVPEACGVPMCVLPTHRRFFEASRRKAPVAALSEDRVKPPSCASCALDRQCIGIWRRYAEVRGTSEFRPVEP